MDKSLMERILAEYAEPGASTGDPGLDAVRTAIFLEDAFDIRLSEEEISPECLGDPASVRRLVAGKLGVA